MISRLKSMISDKEESSLIRLKSRLKSMISRLKSMISRLKSMISDNIGGERGVQWTEVISLEPRASIYHNFLSKEECEYLIKLATPRMKKSKVVDSKTGKSKESRNRTSSGMFVERGQDKVIRAIEKRIADYTLIPVEHGENLQVLHYEVGQKYVPHYDYFVNELFTRNGGQRMATLLMYFTVAANGEPERAKKGISVKPKMGDALLFWNMRPDATLDPLSLHGSYPVIKGDKWSCTKWMHVGEFKIRNRKGV
ncbi:putative prolyl 4-hydroxylase 3 [Salvia divinorum]|uniref:Prolyl 4-hydroxylase 3 n=1 Tax=Salvia divinorum TaxID=28513 RepID=A0ABD1GFZ9_SALDI